MSKMKEPKNVCEATKPQLKVYFNKIEVKKFLYRWFELDDYPPKD